MTRTQSITVEQDNQLNSKKYIIDYVKVIEDTKVCLYQVT